MPDIPNWAWHEYGNRVGFWRMLEVLDRLDIKAVLCLNGSCLATYAPIAEAARERQWEFLGHGFIQKNMQKVEDERDADPQDHRGDIPPSPASGRAAGSAPASPRPGRPPTSSPRKAMSMSATGCSTTSR